MYFHFTRSRFSISSFFQWWHITLPNFLLSFSSTPHKTRKNLQATKINWLRHNWQRNNKQNNIFSRISIARKLGFCLKIVKRKACSRVFSYCAYSNDLISQSREGAKIATTKSWHYSWLQGQLRIPWQHQRATVVSPRREKKTRKPDCFGDWRSFCRSKRRLLEKIDDYELLAIRKISARREECHRATLTWFYFLSDGVVSRCDATRRHEQRG